jgi:Tol biopolymer transport system component
MRIEIEMGSGIAVMDVRRENGRLLGAPPVELLKAFADGPRWSPDGTKLVYVASAEGGWIVYNLDVATTASVGVPGIPENSTDPDWSPDGQQIVFAYYADSVDQMNDLYVINTDGSGLTQLTNTPNINEGEARWSPDGEKIVFTTFERLESGGINKDIFIMNRDGTNITRLTTDPEQDFDPSWSPDGKQIVFVSDRHESNDGNYEIYVINTDGTGELRLTNNRSTDRWPTWRAKQPDDVPVTNCQPAITLIADMTIPAGTRFASPQPFTKIWRVKNSGTCTWTPTHYLLRFGEEGEQMGGAPFVRIPGAIQPGATVDLALPLVAPETPGRHVSHWKVFGRDGNAVPGPDGNPVTLTVDIEVLAAGQTVLPQPLYFLSEQSGSSQIWRMETDARTVKQLTNEPQPVLTLDISATGRIAYVSQYQVFVTDASGQDRQVIATLESDALPRKLAWSPDGNRLAYPSKGIHVYDMTTGEDKLLIADKDTQAPDLARYEPLEWSPDGSKLTLTKYLWESLGINVISVSNGAVLFDQAQQDITWNRDSQSVYLSSPQYSEWTGLESGLWRGLTSGEAPQPLLQGASIWLPVQRADGTLAFFMHQPTTQETKEFTPLLYVSAADGTDPVAVKSWPIMLSANDTFSGVWTEDGQSILIQLVRPALNVSEVLWLTADEKPPVFLTSEPKTFWWGE